MRLRVLDIFIGQQPVGRLFQYGEGRNAITRLKPEPAYWSQPEDRRPVLSLSALTETEAEREAFWREYAVQPFFNGEGERLPPFLQNMLPDGPLRRHLAQIRQCALSDHFELLAACGTDLPGNVYAMPATLERWDVADLVTQHNDALEVTVTAEPVAGATSLSGVQPKLSLVEQGGRYVARTKGADGLHIIAKLPTVEYPLLPEVEELSLRLAAACGVDVCHAQLAPVGAIDADAPFILRQARSFLAVRRFDRIDGTRHVHAEDFAQVLGLDPDDKYTGATYGLMARVMLATPGLGLDAALELVRRLAVNELLGNYDGHLKNTSVLYPDGHRPQLAPAYDVVAYAAYLPGHGHALAFHEGAPPRQRLGPAALRGLCREAGLLQTRAERELREVVKRASQAWPALIAASALDAGQRRRLLEHFEGNPVGSRYPAGAARGRTPAA
mgnify:CR=1 FL=1